MPAPYLVLEKEPAPNIKETERKRLLERIRAMTELPKSATKSIKLNRFELSFYDDVDLIEVRNTRWRPADARLCFLCHGDDIRCLDVTSPPIHQVNTTAELVLTESNVLEYLAFFCFFIRGKEGPFLIIDRIDNPFIPDCVARESVTKVFRPPRIWGQDENGDWRVSAMVYYANGIFVSDFVVHLSGMVDMTEDWPVAERLEGKIEAPLSFGAALNA